MFLCSDKDYLVWERDLFRYRLNEPNNEKLDMWGIIDKDSLTIEEQYQYLSAIPNYHKWVWECEKDRGLMVEQRFSSSCSRYPGCPRNRIVQAIAYRMDCHLIVFSIVKHLFGYTCEIPYKAVKEMKSKRKNAFQRKQKSKKPFRDLKKHTTKASISDTTEIDIGCDCDSLLYIFITERKLSSKTEVFDPLESDNF